MARGCARCGAPMQAVFDRGVEVDNCPADHGIYFDRGELTTFGALPAGVDRSLLALAHRQATRSPLTGCPGCGRALLLAEGGGVQVHPCAYCGGVFVENVHLDQLGALHGLPTGAALVKAREAEAAVGRRRGRAEEAAEVLMSSQPIFGMNSFGTAAATSVEVGSGLLESIGDLLAGLFDGV